jgi:hypothetical protein
MPFSAVKIHCFCGHKPNWLDPKATMATRRTGMDKALGPIVNDNPRRPLPN